MRNWSAPTWLIILWTIAMAWLSIAMLTNPDLRILDIAFGGVALGMWWLVGLAPLTLAWIGVRVLRNWRVRHRTPDQI